ncbi:MAG: histidine kinase [Eubacteriales bacterium]|nr:histidine kinase [Eubacteriales bacterium]
MKNESFTWKLLRSYLILAVIPLIAVMIYVVTDSTSSARRASKQRLESAATLTGAQFGSLLDTMEFVSMSVMCSDDFINMAKRLTYENNTQLEERTYYQSLVADICSYAYVDSVYKLAYFSKKGHFITNQRYNDDYSFLYRIPEETMEEVDWLSKADEERGKTVLLPASDNSVPEMHEEALTLVRAVRDPGEVTGYLVVQMRLEDLSYIFSIDELSDAQILIQDQETVIYATDGFPLQCYQEDPAQFDKAYLSASVTDTARNLKITLASPMELVYASVVDTMKPLILEGVILLAFTIGGICIFSKSLSRPLIALKEEMQHTTLDNLNHAANQKLFESYEETKYLYTEFTHMRARLDTMIQNEIALRTLHTRELLHSLQGQINPHFLYNTLNMIGVMGSESGNDQVYDACLKLSGILRYSIADKNNGLSTIRDELENTRQYLELMKLRFEDRIQWELTCAEEIQEQPILRLVVQPFVENIFEHAFDAAHIRMEIRIRGYEEEGRWVISIEDNGAGISPEALARLLEELQRNYENARKTGSRKQDGIGIENTILRLLLYYKGDFHYTIENRECGGVRILLSAMVKECENA